jgi:hypothetical protein
VNLVNDVDFELAKLRGIANLVDKVTNVIYRVVGSGVQFKNIQGIAVLFFKAIDQSGYDARTSGFAYTTGTAKQKGLRKFIGVDGIFERGGNVFLSHYFIKACGSVFTCRNNKILHWPQDKITFYI